MAIGVGLNLSFVALEAVAGLWAGSLALEADAGHNLFDLIGVLMIWGAGRLALTPHPARREFTVARIAILSGFANAMLLLLGTGAIVIEAVPRLLHPEPVRSALVLAVAAVGIVVNIATALLLGPRGRRRGASRGPLVQVLVEVLADASVSAGVLLSALAIGATGWLWLDPAVSLMIAALIVAGLWRLARGSVDMALQSAPPHIARAEVAALLAAQPGVAAVHELEIWSLGPAEVALCARLERPGAGLDDAFLAELSRQLAARFGITRTCIQVEAGARLTPP